MILRHPDSSRRGIATTELALLAPVLLILLVGIWEVGRLVMVQNLLDSAAREGARLAAAGGFFASSNHTDPSGATISLSAPSTNASCEVQQKVFTYLQVSGVSTTGATVAVSNSGTSSSPKSWSYTETKAGAISGSGYDPAAAADQLDQLIVTVTVPYTSVGWSPLNWFVGSSTTLTGTASWSSMRDIPLTISTNIPTKPIQPTDPLP